MTQTGWWGEVKARSPLQPRLTFLLPGGAGSKMRVCISLGSAEYTGRMISSGTSGPSDFIRSYRISQAVSISSCPVRKTRMSPAGVEQDLRMHACVHTRVRMGCQSQTWGFTHGRQA